MRKTTSTQEYLESLSDLPIKPTSEYEFKAVLLDSEKDEKSFKEMDGREFLLKYSQLIDKDIQTGNIGTDKHAFFAIQKAEILTHFLDMASREPALRGPFILMYNQFRNGLLITKAKNGKWAEQHFNPSGNRNQQGGYGADPLIMPGQPQPNQQDNRNPVQKLMDGFKSR